MNQIAPSGPLLTPLGNERGVSPTYIAWAVAFTAWPVVNIGLIKVLPDRR